MNEEDVQQIIQSLTNSAGSNQEIAGKLQFMEMSVSSMADQLEEANRNLEILLYLIGAMIVLIAIGLAFLIFKKAKS
ncbi:hypothetical protein ACTHPH_20435 [Paenibacillus pasadenensis]|uniref:hypothetical protein n=1 Tax=Paenibacillus TaxID=44249 RepID=UPI00048D5180|nr:MULTISPECIES: hypothetical protein [Paenibacillus]QGG58428.1 hypothetical protein GE073_24495 [Paenibacillus sp. B01]